MTKKALRAKLLKAAEWLDEDTYFSCEIVKVFAGATARDKYSELFAPDECDPRGAWIHAYSSINPSFDFDSRKDLRVLMVLLFREIVSSKREVSK